MAIPLDLATSSGTAHGGCGCGCGSADVQQFRADALPSLIRHGAVIGGVTSLKLGKQVVITFDHDPAPLLTQLARVAPDAVDVEYLERGPSEWRVAFTGR